MLQYQDLLNRVSHLVSGDLTLEVVFNEASILIECVDTADEAVYQFELNEAVEVECGCIIIDGVIFTPMNMVSVNLGDI